MDTSQHTLSTLFDQLGLPSTPEDIDAFVRNHKPLPGEMRLEQANFWSPSQAAFLHEAIEEDSDWCEVVDELDAMLR